MTIEELAREEVGDGKRPNKFWLSVSSDYAYMHREKGEGSMIDYIGDIVEGWEKRYSKGRMVALFDNYREAINAAKRFKVGQNNGETFVVNRVTVEDRLHGEVYEKELTLDIETGKTSVLESAAFPASEM